MPYFRLFITFTFLIISLNCGTQASQSNPENTTNLDRNDPAISPPQTYQLSGTVQKGPFLQGSQITVYELDPRLVQTGRIFQTQTTDDEGSFQLDAELLTPYAEIYATGYYFDEVKGKISSEKLTLRGLVNLAESSKANINILTTLAHERIKTLVKNQIPATEAFGQAHRDIARVFKLEQDLPLNFSELDISQQGNGNAFLLATTSIIKFKLSIAELTQFIAKITKDLANDGHLDSEKLKNKIIDHATRLDLTKIRENTKTYYQSLGFERTIPDFENFVDSDNDGVLNGDKSTDILIKAASDGKIEINESAYSKSLIISLANKKPSSDITLTLSSSHPDIVTLSKSEITFSPENYTKNQRVSLRPQKRFGTTRDQQEITITIKSKNNDVEHTITKKISFSERSPFSLQDFYPNDQTESKQARIRLLETDLLSSDDEINLFITSNREDLVTIVPNQIKLNSSNWREKHNIQLKAIYAFGDYRDGEEIEFTISSDHPDLKNHVFVRNFTDYREPEIQARTIIDPFDIYYPYIRLDENNLPYEDRSFNFLDPKTDSQGNVYSIDETRRNAIKKVSSDGTTTIINDERFSYIRDFTIDNQDHVLVAGGSYKDQNITKINPQGQVELVYTHHQITTRYPNKSIRRLLVTADNEIYLTLSNLNKLLKMTQLGHY